MLAHEEERDEVGGADSIDGMRGIMEHSLMSMERLTSPAGRYRDYHDNEEQTTSPNSQL